MSTNTLSVKDLCYVTCRNYRNPEGVTTYSQLMRKVDRCVILFLVPQGKEKGRGGGGDRGDFMNPDREEERERRRDGRGGRVYERGASERGAAGVIDRRI